MYNALFISYSLALFLSIACFILMALQKPSKEQLIATLITIFIVILVTGYWSSLQAKDVSASVLAQKIIYMGGCHIYYLILRFFTLYCKIRLPLFIRVSIITVNTFIMSSVLFLEHHSLMYKSVEFKVNNGIPNLKKEYGIIHTVYIITMISYMLAILIIAIRQFIRKRNFSERIGTTGLFMIAVFPTAGYAVEKLCDLSFDVVPFCLVISEIILLMLVYQFKLYDINDTAREYAFDVMEDAIVVVDKNSRFKGANNAAMKLFPKLNNAALDDEIIYIDSELAGIITHVHKEDIFYEDRTYMPIIKPIMKKDSIKGYVARFFDVTSEREKTKILENYQRTLETEVESKTAKLQQVQEQVIISFANIVENRDMVTGGHIRRTGKYVTALMNEMMRKKIYSDIMTPTFMANVRLAAPLHDIGKIAVSDDILNKKGKYNIDEFEVMKKHTMVGADIIEKNLMNIEDYDYYTIAKDLALYHHEKWDGQGYPEHLAGEKIPLAARIMAIADVFDALVSERPYKPPFSLDKAFSIIESEKGKSFDPVLVDCFISIRKELEEAAKNSMRDEEDK